MKLTALCCVAGLALGSLAGATGAGDELDREEWRERFQIAREAVATARAERDAALEAYQNMRHRRRVRGDAKDIIVNRLGEAEAAVPRAEAVLDDLYREARAAGVPRGWMRMASHPARRRSE